MNKVRAALEKVMSEDLSEIWTILNADEKRKITDNFSIHPNFSGASLKAKRSFTRMERATGLRYSASFALCNISATGHFSLKSHTSRLQRP